MFFLWRWTQSGGWCNATLAGAFTGYACTIRYTEALLLLPVAAMIAWRWREAKWSEVVVMIAAAAAVVAPLAIHHWLAFGAPWRTGYALCGESTGFSWEWFKNNWWLMVTRLNSPGLMLIFPVGLVGIGYLAAHDQKGDAVGIMGIAATLLYTAYCGHRRRRARTCDSSQCVSAAIIAALALVRGRATSLAGRSHSARL
jgi:hypothetical protein